MIDILIGIDPGKSGGMTVCIDNQPKNLVAYPLEDITTLLEALEEYKEFSRRIVVEECPPFVAGKNIPSSAGFKLGFSCGQIEGVALGMRIPLYRLKPKEWQAGLSGLKGKTGATRKKALKAHATRLYPHLSPTLKTADAILLTHHFINNPN